jgi:hypothetical protein
MPRELKFSNLIMPYIEAFSASLVALAAVTDPTFRIDLRPDDEMSLQGGQGNAINYPIIASIRKLGTSGDLMATTGRLLYQVLLGSSYETLKDHGAFAGKERIPEIAFFRHIRNACFHGNQFHFERDEPRVRASWRGLTIDRSLQGTPLFWRFWKPADPLHLLADISAMLER